MACRRSLGYKNSNSSSSSTWKERREKGELAAFALPLLGTSVSCAPHLFSHWCGTGPGLLRVWAAWAQRSVCVCVCVGGKGLRVYVWCWSCVLQLQPQLPEKCPSGWVQVHVWSFKLSLLYPVFLLLLISRGNLFYCSSLSLSVLSPSAQLRDTDWVNETLDYQIESHSPPSW